MNAFFCTMLITFAVQGMSMDSSIVFFGNYKLPNGKLANPLPPIRDQNQPKACDSCWAFATTTVMSIIFNIQNSGAFPETVLSPQFLINCAPTSIPFNCSYGSNDSLKITDVFDLLKSKGVSNESCNHYRGDDTKDCSDLNQCKDCHYFNEVHRQMVCKPVKYRA